MLYSHEALIDDQSSQCTAALMITPICLNELFNQLYVNRIKVTENSEMDTLVATGRLLS